MATTTQEAMIESIYEGDDAAIQARADRCEEKGDLAGAELIRVQAKLDGGMISHTEETSLLRRQEELLAEHKSNWVAHLPRPPGIEYEFVRGLPRAVAKNGYALRRSAKELAMYPEVRAARLKDICGVHSLENCPYLAHFKSLNLININLSLKTLPSLAGCPYLAGLTEFCLHRSTLTLEHVKSLAGALYKTAPCWKGLRRLDVSYTGGGVGVIDVVSILGRLASVRYLDITNSWMREGNLERLCEMQDIEALTTLRMGRCGLTDDCIEVLARSKHAPSLTTIDLSGNEITSDGALELVDSQSLIGLRRVKLTSCRLGKYILGRLRERFGDGLVTN